MLHTIEQMIEDESLCENYCYETEYGKYKCCYTPDGIVSCEGRCCEESYEDYLEENEVNKNIVKYANMVFFLNEEDFK